ncbi:MAG: hypothetical protein ACTHJM_16630, partial [Marmoricola sp.]
MGFSLRVARPTRPRAAARIAAVAAVALLASVLNVSSASAESTIYGRLLLGGVGGKVSGDPYTARAGAPGAVLSYPIQVHNYSGVDTQFRVFVGPSPWGTKLQVLNGTGADATTLAETNGYYSAPLWGYGTENLTIKLTLPSGTPSDGFDSVPVTLEATDGTYITTAYLIAGVTPAKGQPATSSDLSVTAKSSTSATAGNQPAVGDPYGGMMSAPLIAPKPGSTTFTATLTNHSTSTVQDNLALAYSFSDAQQQYAASCSSDPTISTATMQANVLSSPVTDETVILKPGASVTYTVTVKVSSWQSCEGVYYTLEPGTW